MGKFIRKIVIYVSVLFMLIQVLYAFIPYHWGNPYFSVKVNHLEAPLNNSYNLYFFGSSRVNRQIDPFVFDSVIRQDSKIKIKSFNLGSPATFCPQSYYLVEKFLDSGIGKNAKYCLVELMPVNPINDFFFHQEQTNYWINHNELEFIIESNLHNKRLSHNTKTNNIKRYLTSYIENMLHIGHMGKQIITDNYYDTRFIGPNIDGYYPMDHELRTVKDELIVNHLTQISEEIKKDSSILNTRLNIAIENYNNIADDFDSVHFNRISKMIENANELDIHTVFFISPRNSSQELINLFNAIPNENKIDMGNPFLYKDYYLLKYAFDRGHLNENGAQLYSVDIAKELIQLIEKNDSNNIN
jgi:hypothetical protein